MLFPTKVAVVTGAGSGIGAATAVLLAKEGARVAVVDREAERAAEVAARIGSQGALAVTADVAHEEDVALMVERVIAEWGTIDLLHNQAGLLHAQDASILSVTAQAIDDTLAVNVKGQMLVAKHVAGAMVRAGRGGAIVNTASDLAFIALSNVCAYITSKAAIAGLTRAMAAELASHNIRVNAVCPGFVYTGMTAGLAANEAIMEEMRKSYLIKRLGQPEDVAQAVVYLLSDQAGFVTGSLLTIDGGHTIL
jgi:NAD(P)-dependent dehydrogenase (short-subunit alcohol dehydrogenase family)